MAEVWPLDLHQTDKWVLLALADSANDEDDGKTWIPIVSKQPRTKRGRLKLSLVVKTRLSETTIRECIKRLVAAGQITREEKPGLGCTYWVHPVPDETPAAPEGVREPRASGGEVTPAGKTKEPKINLARVRARRSLANRGRLRALRVGPLRPLRNRRVRARNGRLKAIEKSWSGTASWSTRSASRSGLQTGR